MKPHSKLCISGGLRKLGEGFEWLGTQVRRRARNDLGFSQRTAQNAGDIAEIAAQIFVPTVAGNVVKPFVAAGITKFRTNIAGAFTRVGEIADAANKAPYHPRLIEMMLKSRYPETEAHTLPGFSRPNVRLAGMHKERIVGYDPYTMEPIIQRVTFDQRGFPVFDPYVKVETRISGDLGSMRSEKHMQLATQQLKADILANRVNGNMFNEAQISDIMSERKKIRGYTWHHHQETGRMQLVHDDVHDWIKHIGGNKLWGTGE